MLPSAIEVHEFTCVVRIHESRQNTKVVSLTVCTDDQLLDLKRRVVHECEGDENGARRASDLYAWNTLLISRDSAISYIVDNAMESGGSNSIGPRIVTVGHLWETYRKLCGDTRHSRDQERFVTHREALTEVRERSGVCLVSVPLGVSHKTSVPIVMTADPFSADMMIDENLASRTGDLRDEYDTSTIDDSMTLETVFKAHTVTPVGDYCINMTSATDVAIHVRKEMAGTTEEAWRGGFLPGRARHTPAAV